MRPIQATRSLCAGHPNLRRQCARSSKFAATTSAGRPRGRLICMRGSATLNPPGACCADCKPKSASIHSGTTATACLRWKATRAFRLSPPALPKCCCNRRPVKSNCSLPCRRNGQPVLSVDSGRAAVSRWMWHGKMESFHPRPCGQITQGHAACAPLCQFPCAKAVMK